MSKYESRLLRIKKDPQQYTALLSKGNTTVLAGPGSGKTTVLTMKIVKLLNEDILAPRGLACVTFSNEAAKEFRSRLKELGLKKRDNVFLGTVHSFCISEIIVPFGHLYPKYNIPLPLNIISSKNKSTLFKNVLDDLGIEYEQVSILEMNKERYQNLNGKTAVNIPSYDLALRVATEYEKRLVELGFVDFEIIIKYATLLIQEEDFVRKCLEAKFPWILIDEYQDLGRPLHEMILSLIDSTAIKIFAVGDPDQSIYSFSGGIPDYLLELFNFSNMNKVSLKTNYRSNQDIVDASELALNVTEKRNYIAGTRFGEMAEFSFITCEDGMDDQYKYVLNTLIPDCVKRGTSLDEIAVIVASNKEASELSRLCDVSSIPNYISKHDFERSEIVVWMEQCATWVHDPTAVSFEDIYSFWRKIQSVHGLKTLKILDMEKKRALYDILTDSTRHKNSLGSWIAFILNKINVRNLLKNSSAYPDELTNLEKLYKLSIAGKFSRYNISMFSRLGKPQNQITITTRHSSKGLEFEVIILLGMDEERFPSFASLSNERKLAEEHRIFFVCVSRAKSNCYLLRSNYYNVYSKKYNKSYRIRYYESRFWSTIYTWYSASRVAPFQ
ncbi:ATP-dependent helicase [Paenibacillus paridis]|uniref:ATP-dependent helicase n=1 Tax=Paenibacillus paridis TaxID=2583376 RepID=UPI00111E89B7|nr:ATP-dependent helicase [Paenibacillus paridis]